MRLLSLRSLLPLAAAAAAAAAAAGAGESAEALGGPFPCERGGPLLRRGCAVCVRIRPESFEEAQMGPPCCIELGAPPEGPDGRQELLIRGLRSHVHHFSFDRVFHESVSQGEVFTVSCLPVVRSVFNGISGAVLAYGQTGAGKTYTMTGPLDVPGGPLDGRPPLPLTRAQRNNFERRRGSSPAPNNTWGPPPINERGAPLARGAPRPTAGPPSPPHPSARRQSLGGPPGGTMMYGGPFGAPRDPQRVDYGASWAPPPSLPVEERGPPQGGPLGEGDVEGDSFLRRHSVQVTDLRGLMPRALEELFKSIEALRNGNEPRGPPEGPPPGAPAGRNSLNAGRGPPPPFEEGGPQKGLQQEEVDIQLTATLVEIYNERILDLLDPTKGPLSIREGPNGQTFVADATEVELFSYPQALQVREREERQKETGQEMIEERLCWQ